MFRRDAGSTGSITLPTPQNVDLVPWGILYDANGNRTSFHPYGTTDTYVTNNLNQYSSRNNINATYDYRGNLATGFDGSTYQYDAQNRLVGAPNMTFKYDGLNRQVSRSVTGQPTTYSVWDGWDLVEEYQMPGPAVQARYLHGPTGLVKNLTSGNYYYQDASGSTSHLADGTGHLLEWYRYDLQGTPIINDDPSNNVSAYGVRHLFTGQQWYSEVGLYDLRNRFYSPDIGRFLQPDPSGFAGDASNLYRYCRNNPVTSADPMGLEAPWPGYPGPFDGSVDFTSTDNLFLAGLTLGLGGPWFFVAGGAISLTSAALIDLTIVVGVVYSQPHGWSGMPSDEPPPGGTRQNPPPPRGPAPIESIKLITLSDGNDATHAPGGGIFGSGSGAAYARNLALRTSALQTSNWQGFGAGFSLGGLSTIGAMFDFGGTSIGGTFGGGLSFTNAWGAFTNPMGTMGLFYGGASGGWNMGAGELINAFTERGLGPKDL
jgi:RHS repeat-associated protein